MTTPEQDILNRLKKTLNRTENDFNLFFCLSNLTTEQQRLGALLSNQLKRAVCEINIDKDALQNNTLDAWLTHQLQNCPKENLVFIYQLSDALPNQQQELNKTLQQLNWRRSALAKINRPVVIWLPAYRIKQLAEYAPDFYDWYSQTYEFNSSEQGLNEHHVLFQNTFIEPELGAHLHMSKNEKERWLHTLSSLLAEHLEKDSYYANLINEQGLLYHSLNYFNEALKD